MRTDMMPLQATPSDTTPMLEYRDQSMEYRRNVSRLLRGVCVLLVLAATACVAIPYHVPILDISRWLAGLAGVGWVLRALDLPRFVPLRSVWALGTGIFGLWTAVVAANQFHGRPPEFDRYLIGLWSTSMALSIMGFVFDTPRLKPSNERR
jgi:hypothetical protein